MTMNSLTYKNIVSLSIYAAALTACIYYKLYASCAVFEISLPFMCVYFVIDMRNESNSLYKLHHFVCLVMFIYGYYYSVKLDDAGILLYTILKTELSSVFLVLHSILDKQSCWYQINNVAFFLCFTKTRIVDMYQVLIRHDSTLYSLVEKYTPDNSFAGCALISCCYVLYGLNLYWFMTITKVAYGMLVRNTRFNTEQISQYICSYTYFVSIPICALMYPYEVPYIYETASVCMLAVTSYMYHNNMYNKLIDAIPATNLVLMINDNICIHLRSFLTLYTNYYLKSSSALILTISGAIHMSSVYFMVYTIIQFTQNKYPTKTRFYQVIYSLCFYPLFIDMVFNCANSTREYYNPILLVNWFIICVFLAEPFDKLNHIAFHLLLNKNTYYQCLMNLHTNRQ